MRVPESGGLQADSSGWLLGTLGAPHGGRRERRLRSMLRLEGQTVAVALAEASHHSAPKGLRATYSGPRATVDSLCSWKAAGCLEGARAAGGSRSCTLDGSIGVASQWVRSAAARRRKRCRVHRLLDGWHVGLQRVGRTCCAAGVGSGRRRKCFTRCTHCSFASETGLARARVRAVPSCYFTGQRQRPVW